VTAKDVAVAVAFDIWNPFRQIIVPNVVGITGEEADLLVLQDSGYLEEIEIKVSKSDFRREFAKKQFKHRVLLEGKPEHMALSMRDSNKAWREFYALPLMDRSDWSKCEPQLVRRFWFAMPLDLATELAGDIPEWAGLIAVRETKRWRPSASIVKKAPNLKNSRKLTDEEQRKLIRYGYVRFWDLTLKAGQAGKVDA